MRFLCACCEIVRLCVGLKICELPLCDWEGQLTLISPIKKNMTFVPLCVMTAFSVVQMQLDFSESKHVKDRNFTRCEISKRYHPAYPPRKERWFKRKRRIHPKVPNSSYDKVNFSYLYMRQETSLIVAVVIIKIFFCVWKSIESLCNCVTENIIERPSDSQIFQRLQSSNL